MSKLKSQQRMKNLKIREWLLISITGISVAFSYYQAHISERARKDAKSASDKQYELAKREAEDSERHFQAQWRSEREQSEAAANHQRRSLEIAIANLTEAQNSFHNQIKAMYLAQRPYITAASAFVEPYIHRTFLIAGGKTIRENIPGKFHVTFSAHGGSPARNVRIVFSECRSGVWHLGSGTSDDGVTIKDGDLSPVATLAPNSSYELTCQPNTGEGTPDDVKFSAVPPLDIWDRTFRIIGHAGGIKIAGKILYSDMFNEDHETSFCFQNRINSDGYQQLGFCGKGNDAL